jgi:hypothetical protein
MFGKTSTSVTSISVVSSFNSSSINIDAETFKSCAANAFCSGDFF